MAIAVYFNMYTVRSIIDDNNRMARNPWGISRGVCEQLKIREPIKECSFGGQMVRIIKPRPSHVRS